MKTLSVRLNEIDNEAIAIIRQKLAANDYKIIAATIHEDLENGDDISEEFKESTACCNEPDDFVGWDDMYLLKIEGSQHEATLYFVTETGYHYEKDLFDLSSDSRCSIADWITANNLIEKATV